MYRERRMDSTENEFMEEVTKRGALFNDSGECVVLLWLLD